MTDTSKLTAVIVDDDDLMRRIIQVALQGIDCELLGEAEDGVEGVAMVRDLKPDLILVDIRMPNLNGFETLKQIKADDPDAYVVMLTALEDEDAIEECMINGARDYLKKNMPMQDMVARLQRHADRLRKV